MRMSQMDYTVSLEIMLKMILSTNSILIRYKKPLRSIHIHQFLLLSLLLFLQSSLTHISDAQNRAISNVTGLFSKLTIRSASVILISQLKAPQLHNYQQSNDISPSALRYKENYP